MNYIKYPYVDYVMPFMFTNDVWILALNELLKNELNPIKDIYGSVYCAWQSGRHAKVFSSDLNEIEKYIQSVTNLGLTPNFTFSSTSFTQDKLNDVFSNQLLDIAYKYNSYFIVASDLLYEHIKKRYNNAKMVCSVILSASLHSARDFNETDFYNRMLDKYEFVVLRPEYTIENMENLEKLLSDISRAEVLINQNCFYNCPNHKKHYDIQEKTDFLINEKVKNKKTQIKIEESIMSFCPRYNIEEEKFRSVRLNTEQVDFLIQSGVRKIKLQGREGRVENLFNDIFEYMFNKEHSIDEIKHKFNMILSDIVLNKRNLQYKYILGGNEIL